MAQLKTSASIRTSAAPVSAGLPLVYEIKCGATMLRNSREVITLVFSRTSESRIPVTG